MKHALRKYLSSSGSALFLVVSTMAALMLLVTAMYLSVISAGRVQLNVFNQEQAYISASSMTDMLAAKMIESQSHPVVKAMMGLDKGESLSTGGNDFASLVSGGTRDDEDFGAYDVTITRLNDEELTIAGAKKTHLVYDIAVSVMKSGVVETSHVYVQVAEGESSDPPTIDRFFTGTGYLPNDVYVSSAQTNSELYFDNEYVIFGDHAYTGGDSGGLALELNVDITCVGTANFEKFQCTVAPDHPLTWVVGNDMLINCSQGINMGGTTTERATMIVGGDLKVTQNIGMSANTDIYIGGNLIVDDSMINFKNCNVYVMGDIIAGANTPWGFAQGWSDFGNLYINGTWHGANGSAPNDNGNTIKMGPVPSDAADRMSQVMNECIQVNVTYPKWDIDTLGLPIENITFCSDPNDGDGVNSKYVHYINKDCTIGDVIDLSTGAMDTNDLAIVIDTGSDPKGERHISLQANAGGDMFMWFPEYSSSKRINVITVGCGILVLDVPEGVTYQATDQEFFGHISWFMMAGGSVKSNTQGNVYFTREDTSVTPNRQYSMYDDFADSVISSGIVYTTDENTCSFSYSESKGTGEDEVKFYECATHGGLYRESAVEAYKDSGNDLAKCPCIGRILPAKVNNFYASNPGALAEINDYFDNYYGPSGAGASTYNSVVRSYPNVNIYVVSVHENADIQFAMNKATKEGVMNNVFFGYVYAPYMTFIAIGTGGGFKNVGGLVVSDITMTGDYQYLFVQPEFRIDYLFADKFEGLEAQGSRAWRYDGV